MGKLTKMLMIVGNIVFWAMGATLLGITIWLSVDSQSKAMANITGLAGVNVDIYWAAVYLLMVMGIFVIFAGLAGCLGAMRHPDGESILKAYFGFVKLIVLIEIVVIVLAAVYKGSINDDVQQTMIYQIQNNYTGDQNPADKLSRSWNDLQISWKCCGSSGHRDYDGSWFQRNSTRQIPGSCCVSPQEPVSLLCTSRLNSSHFYQEGCYGQLKSTAEDNSIIIIVIASVFAGIQLVGSIFACLLMRDK